MMLFLNGPSLFINCTKFCLSEGKSKMVRKTKVQSKRLERLRNIVLDVLYIPLYISCLPPVDLAKLQWGFSAF